MGKQDVKEQPWMLERRAFLKLGSGFGLGMVLGWLNQSKLGLVGNAMAAGPTVSPRASARNCLMVVLRGGPSHIDTFDIKVGNWTPKKLGVDKTPAGYLWPIGIMPHLAQRSDKFSLVRSLQHQEVVHERAQYYLETGRRLNPGLRLEIPHVGAVVALENEERRATSDIFPSFVMLNLGFYFLSNNGFLSNRFAPFLVTDPMAGINNLEPLDGLFAFERRRATFQLLNGIDDGQEGSPQQQLSINQEQAEKLMRDPITSETFHADTKDVDRYGSNYFGLSLAVARNILKANRGTRFIEVDHYGWDHHLDIYSDGSYGLPALAMQFDLGLSALLDDLAALPGVAPGKSLLDETLVVVLGEFGRTVGPLKGTGRDHYPYIFSGLFAGGGVKGGRVIGATDDSGASVKDNGWSNGRAIHMPDLVTTIYSALGIDWTKTITNTPSGRVYRYADPQVIGDNDSYEISQLF